MSINAISAIAGNSANSELTPTDYMEKLSAKIIEQRDKDGDGVLNAEEAMLPKEVFSILDTDGDGKITAKELKAESTEVKNALHSVSKTLSNVDKISAEGKFNDLMLQAQANKAQ